MNKEEILNRSKKENQWGDEREKMIEKNASDVSLTAILVVNAIFIVIIFFQNFFTGESFADQSVFFLAILISYCGSAATKYYYKRERSQGILGVISLIGAIATIANIILF